jgi:hypothetical protein
MALFMVLAFYNRSKIIGGGQRVHKRDMTNYNTFVLVCGSEVPNLTCRTWGSRMKKPVF